MRTIRQTAAERSFTDNNSSLGYYSLMNNRGGNNTAVGAWSSYGTQYSQHNVSLGAYALYANGFTNSLVPFDGNNVAIGAYALYANNPTSTSNGIRNVAIGRDAMYNNTTGYRNIAIGTYALKFNTGGIGSVAIGDSALTRATAAYNTAIGDYTLARNTTGNQNVAVGSWALRNNSTGSVNIAMGTEAMVTNTIGSYNVALGEQAMYYNTTGDYNTSVGTYTLGTITTGDGNIAYGYQSGYSITTGAYNTRLGYIATNGSEGAWTNTGMIGYAPLSPGGNNVYRIGNASVTGIGGQVGWTTVSDARIKEKVKQDIPGLDFITRLRPVSYQYNISRQNKIMDPNRPDTADWEGKYDIEKMRFSGFLAQEVDSIARSIGYEFSGVEKPKSSGGLYGLRYAEFTVPLVKAVQEQQLMIQSQNNEIAALRKQNEVVLQAIDALRLQNEKLMNEMIELKTGKK